MHASVAVTEQVDATNYKGTVKVKVGPATASFAGDIEVLGIDEAARQIRMLGKGADKGGSSASMQLTASLIVQDDQQVALVGKADVIVNGKFAQFGGRMMTSVSDMILKQFADNFSVKAQAAQAALASAESDSQAPQADTPNQVAAQETANISNQAAEAPKMQTELNGLAIMWMLIKNFFARLFGKSA